MPSVLWDNRPHVLRVLLASLALVIPFTLILTFVLGWTWNPNLTSSWFWLVLVAVILASPVLDTPRSVSMDRESLRVTWYGRSKAYPLRDITRVRFFAQTSPRDVLWGRSVVVYVAMAHRWSHRLGYLSLPVGLALHDELKEAGVDVEVGRLSDLGDVAAPPA